MPKLCPPIRRCTVLLLVLLAGCGGSARSSRAPAGAGGEAGDSTGEGGEAGGSSPGGSGGSPEMGHDAMAPDEPDAAIDAGDETGGAGGATVDAREENRDSGEDRGRDGAGGMGGAGTDGGTVVNGIRHPGMVSSEAELDRIRTIVNAPASHPMKDGWNKLRAERYAQLTYQATPYAVVHVAGSGGNAEESAIRNDAVAAYAHALQWAILDDPKYSAKAIEIMTAWGKVLQDVVPATAADPSVQDELETAWYAPMWLNAAEIIRYHRGGAANWAAADRAAFDKMVTLFKAKADAWDGSKGCCPNQGISVAFSRLSIAVYTSDKAYYDKAITFYRDTMLPRSIASSGEVIEINRTAGGDCYHATYNIEGAFDIAETAWHQGTNLYANPLLPKGLEYMAQLLTTGAQTTSEGMVTCSTKPDSIEIAYNHYVNRVGMPALPHTTALLTKLRPSDQGSGKFIPWDTFTHADLDK